MLNLTLLLVVRTWQRRQGDFNPTVLGTTIYIRIAGNRIIGTGTLDINCRGVDALRCQVGRNTLSTTLRQINIVLKSAGTIRVTNDIDLVLVILLQ